MRLSCGSSMTEFQVKTTSSAVNGCPSLQRTPWRSLKVHVRLSAATDQDSARPGPGSSVAQSMLTSEAKRRRATRSDAESLTSSGLKVLGRAGNARVSSPPGRPGSHLEINADAGNGCPFGLEALSL